MFRALQVDEPLARAEALAGTFRRLGPEAVDEVRAGYRDARFGIGAQDKLLLAHWWGRFDPAAALAWARESAFANLSVQEAAMEEYGRIDPAGAQQELAKVLQSEQHQALARALVRGWADSGKPGLVEFLAGQEQRIEQHEMVDSYVYWILAHPGAQAAREWALSLPDSDARFKTLAFQRVTAGLARLEPEGAFAFAVEHSQGPFGTGLLQLVAGPWGREDGLAAVTHLRDLPEMPQRRAAVRDAFTGWLQTDRAAAVAFAEQVADEPWFEYAAQRYSLIVAANSMEDGLRWANRIQDPTAREEAYVKIARHWRLKDEEAVKKWLATVELTEPALKQIWAPLPQLHVEPAPPVSGGQVPKG